MISRSYNYSLANYCAEIKFDDSTFAPQNIEEMNYLFSQLIATSLNI